MLTLTTRISLACSIVLLAFPVCAGVFLPQDFSALHNSRMQNYDGQASSYPEGSVTLGGVPFDIPAGGLNVWNATAALGDNPRILSIPVGVFGVDKVHTLINTWWGQIGGGTFASVRFLGTGALDYSVSLDGNDDIRDYLQTIYANSINGTTTVEVFKAGSGHYDEVRLDKQVFDLPAAFNTETLLSIELIDNGGENFQRVFLAGMTVELVPEPELCGVFAGIGMMAFAMGRRRVRGDR